MLIAALHHVVVALARLGDPETAALVYGVLTARSPRLRSNSSVSTARPASSGTCLVTGSMSSPNAGPILTVPDLGAIVVAALDERIMTAGASQSAPPR